MWSETSDKGDLGANMVLRTVYLPLTMDDELRRRAFDWHKSKNEIMRECVRVALEAHADELFVESKPARVSAASGTAKAAGRAASSSSAGLPAMAEATSAGSASPLTLDGHRVRWISPLWHLFLAGEMATAAAASPQEHVFSLDEGEITLTCDWYATSPNQPATLRVAWQATLSRPTDLWLRFTQPNDPTALYSEVRLGEDPAGEAVFLEQTIRFDPARQPWALALVLKELEG